MNTVIQGSGTTLDAAEEYKRDYEANRKKMLMQKAQDAFDAENTQSEIKPVQTPNVETAPQTPKEQNTEQADQGRLEKLAPEDEEGIFSTIAKGIGGFVGSLPDATSQLIGGPIEAINEGLDLADELGQTLEDKLGIPNIHFDLTNEVPDKFILTQKDLEENGLDNFELPNVPDPDTTLGKFTKSTTQFLTGFIPALRGMKAMKAPALAKELGAGALSSAVVFDPYEDRLATFLNEVPALDAIVPDYLADTNPENQGPLEGRLKNAIEDAGLGVFAEGLIRGFKMYKVQRKAVKEAKMLDMPEVEVQRMEAQAALKQSGEITQEISEEALAPLGKADGDLIEFIDDTAPVIDDIAEGASNELTPNTLLNAPRGEKKVFVNMARIQEPTDVKEAIQALANADAKNLADKTGGVVKNTELIKASDQEFTDLSDLIGRNPGPMTGAEAIAARKLLNSSAEQLVELAKKAKAPDATKADIYNFRRGVSVHYAIQSEVVAARTETARALQSWNIPVGSDKQRGEMINELIGSVGGNADIQKMAQAISDVGHGVGVNDIVKQSMTGQYGKAAYQVWINGLLSSPKTHMVNILSNTLTNVWAIPERYLASGISKTFYDGEIAGGEAAALAYGAAKGIRDGFTLVMKGQKASNFDKDITDIFDAFVKAEDVYEDALTAGAFKVDDLSPLGKGINYMGKAINLPTNLLGKEDQFFKSVGYRMELHARAYRDAIQKGLEGKEMAEHIADTLRNPPKDIKAESLDFAHYQTFTNPLGEKGRSVQKMINKVPGMRLVVPFIRTPTNILKFTFARTPLSYLASQTKADIAAGGARAAQAHARVALGSMVMMTMADMSAEGHITGAGPADKKLQGALYRDGWKPYSIKHGDRYYQYNRLDPIGMFIGLAADMQEINKYSDTARGDELVTAGVLALSGNLASKTYLSGIYDLIAAIDPSNPTSDPGKYLQNLVTSFAPYSSFVRSITTAADTTIRDTRTSAADPIAEEYFDGMPEGMAEYMTELVNNYRRQIPGLSDELPARLDLWGEPIDRASGFGVAFDFLSPVSSRVGKESAVDKVIFENQIKLSMPSRQIKGVDLTGEEYHAYVEMAGKPAKEALNRMIKMPAFKRLSTGPDGMKAQQMQGILNKYRNIAQQRMMMEFPDLRQRIMKKKMEKATALKGQ